MEAWIRVHHDLGDHPKVYRLAEALKIDQYAAVGLVVCLWIWTVTYAPDGDLARFPDTAIARACHWNKPAAGLVKALAECGFIDSDRRIHDWDVYASALIEMNNSAKEKTRKRVEEYRRRQRTEALQQDGGNVTCNGDVTLPSVTCNVTESVTEALQQDGGNVTERYGNAVRGRGRIRIRNIDTHTDILQQPDSRTRTRTREGEPELFDDAWKDSASARGAVAQRVIDWVRGLDGFSDQFTVTEAGPVGKELHKAMCAAMETGVSPERCRDIGVSCLSAWKWEGMLKEIVIKRGISAPDEWRDQVDELKGDLMEEKA